MVLEMEDRYWYVSVFFRGISIGIKIPILIPIPILGRKSMYLYWKKLKKKLFIFSSNGLFWCLFASTISNVYIFDHQHLKKKSYKQFTIFLSPGIGISINFKAGIGINYIDPPFLVLTHLLQQFSSSFDWIYEPEYLLQR